MSTKPNIGETVILRKVPPTLLHGLPEADQSAIRDAIGGPVTVVAHGDYGIVELEFSHNGNKHTIWIDITVALSIDYGETVAEFVEASDERIELIGALVPKGFQSGTQMTEVLRRRILASNQRYAAAKQALKQAMIEADSLHHDKIKM